jgi:hypothetical protein
MIFEPGLLKHPKFLGLSAKLGGEGVALGVLYRLWEHCQQGQRGACWGAVGATYVESVCGWVGRKNVLFNWLRFPLGKEHGGWIDLKEDGVISIHEWESYNGSLVRNWTRNLTGKRLGASGSTGSVGARATPRGAHGVPTGMPAESPRGPRGEPDKRREEKRRVHTPISPLSSGEVQVLSGEQGKEQMSCADGGNVTLHPRMQNLAPGLEEVVAAGAAMNPVMDEARCFAFWSHYEGQARESENGEKFWVTGSGSVITNWRAKLATWSPKGTNFAGSASSSDPNSIKNAAGAMGNGQWAMGDKKEAENEPGWARNRRLKEERAELERMIGVHPANRHGDCPSAQPTEEERAGLMELEERLKAVRDKLRKK